MQPLLRTLQDQDLGHLRIIAELWGLDPPAGEPRRAAEALTQAMLSPGPLGEVLASLDGPTLQALEALIGQGGRAPLADLTRRFGELREMGPGRRDREKPWRAPVSPLESLWYRGLLARAFADGPTGPQEYAFIPSDLLERLPRAAPSAPPLLGRPAAAPLDPRPAGPAAVDDATTLLAALRRRSGRGAPGATWWQALARFLRHPESRPLLLALLQEEDIVTGPGLRPHAEATRLFLDSPLAAAQAQLLLAWLRSRTWNDLQAMASLAAGKEGWPNDPPASRQAALELLRQVPPGTWWDLEAFVQAVHDRHPGYLRPAGDFDSWYLRDAQSGEFRRGFDHWQAVDGALLRHLITSPVHLLGAADLGAPHAAASPTHFRLTPLALALFGGVPQAGHEPPPAPAEAAPDGRLILPARASRTLRYQLARASDWEALAGTSYTYRLTPSALAAAAAQGLQPAHVRAVLDAACQSRVPAALLRAIDRAAARGPEARLEQPLILRVREARLMTELRARRSTARYLGEALGPAAAVVLARDWDALAAAAARLGILLDLPGARFP